MSATIRSIAVGEYDEKNRLLDTTFPNPTWERFLDVFENVQKRVRPFAGITITAADGSWLLIDGSDGLFFVLYQNASGFQFQPLPDPSQPEGEVTIILGGVNTTLPRAFLFDEPKALKVVRDFWQGQLEVLTGWEPL